jgi:hypothetical protein
MAIAAIVINQEGKSPGLPRRSRDDLVPGAQITLTNHSNTDAASWTWELLSSPAGSEAKLRGATNPVAFLTPDRPGPYLIRLTVGGPNGMISDSRVAIVGTPFLFLPAPMCDMPDRWDFVLKAFNLLDDGVAGSLRRDGSSKPVSDTDWGGRRITGLGGLEVDGVIRLGETDDPEAIAGKGFLYMRRIGKCTDLFYCGADGALVRLTRDGRLNIPGMFDDRIKLGPKDDSPGYLYDKLEAGPGLERRIENGVLYIAATTGDGPGTLCAGNDPRLSRDCGTKPHSHSLDEIGTSEPKAGAVPISDDAGKLDGWISPALPGKRGILRLSGDLAGSADKPSVIGIGGIPLPQGSKGSFLRWSDDGRSIEAVPYGSMCSTVCSGDDPRLSDPRVPSGRASGQLAGAFPSPTVVGVTDSDHNNLRIGKIPDGSLLVRQGNQIVGSGTAGMRPIAMAMNERSHAGEEKLVGCFLLDGGSTAVFTAIGRVSSPKLAGMIRLRNITDGSDMAEIPVVETSLASRRVRISIPEGKKLCGVFMALADEDGGDGFLECMWAGLLV